VLPNISALLSLAAGVPLSHGGTLTGPCHLEYTAVRLRRQCLEHHLRGRLYELMRGGSLGLSLNRKRILSAGPYLRKGVGQWQLKHAMQGKFAAKRYYEIILDHFSTELGRRGGHELLTFVGSSCEQAHGWKHRS
jgi:hypothetical protein